MACVETHKPEESIIGLTDLFKNNGRRVKANPSQYTGRSEEGTHGGEMMKEKSWKSNHEGEVIEQKP